jgi:hypothetical protein
VLFWLGLFLFITFKHFLIFFACDHFLSTYKSITWLYTKHKTLCFSTNLRSYIIIFFSKIKTFWLNKSVVRSLGRRPSFITYWKICCVCFLSWLQMLLLIVWTKENIEMLIYSSTHNQFLLLLLFALYLKRHNYYL